jgi:membrane fusion protein (multidrug efflux system)
MRTLLVYLLAACALAVGVWFGFPELLGSPAAQADEDAPRAAVAAPVVVAVVARERFEDTLEALGTAHARESVEIAANRADHVHKIHFQDGEEVAAGQLLVELHAEEEQALLAEASALRDDQAVRHQQIAELFEQDLSSRRDLDNATALKAAAEARVIALQAAIADRQVRAPFAGKLGFRRVSEGAYLQPGAVITTLDDLSLIKLDFTIPEGWLSEVHAGMAIGARTSAWPGEVFPGTVTVVETRLDPRTRSATVRAELPNGDRKLRPGMLLQVTVERGDAPVLQIPEEALIPLDERQFVMQVGDDSVARRVQITTGRRRVGHVEVLDGLAPGDRVVVEGIMRVRDGAPVDVVVTRNGKP